MKITLKKLVNELLGNKKELQTYKYYLKRTLQYNNYQNIVLYKGEVVEVQDGVVTISFSWDNISAVNNLTNLYVDIHMPDNAFNVFD